MRRAYGIELSITAVLLFGHACFTIDASAHPYNENEPLETTMLVRKRQGQSLRVAATLLFALSSVGSTANAQGAACSLNFTSPQVIPIAGTLGDLIVDDRCEYVYVTNTTQNRVEVFSLQTLTLQPPIQVGSQPVGLDITPDGRRMYVANSGGNNISVVDLMQRIELRKITVPSGFSNDTPYSIAIASNELALFSTTFAGSGFGARMMQLDLGTDAVTQRTDFWFSGTTTERTQLSASGDRGTISIVAGDISSGPVFKYTANTNTFSPEKDLNAFISTVSLDQTGSTLLVTPGAYVLDAALGLTGTISLEPGWGGNAMDPGGAIGYRAVASRVDVLDLVAFLKTGELPLGDTVNQAALFNTVGHMDISGDGRLLAIITDHGLSLVGTGVAPPLDTTAPLLNVPREITVPSTSPAGAVVSFVVTATDDTDPNPTVSCTPASGSLFPIATTTVMCTATDASENSVTATFLVHVIGPQLGPRELLENVLADVLAGRLGPGRSLASKLRAALAALAKGRRTNACGIVGALVNEVRAQSGKQLTAQHATRLIMRVDAARAALGCLRIGEP